jgi:hypothetical protein
LWILPLHREPVNGRATAGDRAISFRYGSNKQLNIRFHVVGNEHSLLTRRRADHLESQSQVRYHSTIDDGHTL